MKEVRSGRKTNEITKFSVWDEKTKFTILMKSLKVMKNITFRPNYIQNCEFSFFIQNAKFRNFVCFSSKTNFFHP